MVRSRLQARSALPEPPTDHRRQATARHIDDIWPPAFRRYGRDMHPEDKCDFRYNS